MAQLKGTTDRETALPALHAAMKRRLRRRIQGAATMVVPAIPSLAEHYCDYMLEAFAFFGRPFAPADAEQLRELVRRVVDKAWEESPYARLHVEYHTEEAPEGGVSYDIKTVIQSVGEAYDTWIGSRPQPFFGAHANAKVMSLAHSLGIPESVAVLDIGAGDGRNTLPLAQAGFPTDSVEVSEGFAQLLRTKLLEAKLPGEVFQGDLLDSNLGLPIAHYKLVVLAGVLVAHVRGTHHLRAILGVVSKVLRPGGEVLFSIFRTREGFEPDVLTRQLGEVFWTVMLTPAELSEAVEGLGLTLDDVAYADYEREALPESWPPADYFQAYVDGLDLFDLPAKRTPIDLRWLTY